jgi:hypothetical protein
VDLTRIIETSAFYFDDAFEAMDSNELLYQRTIEHMIPFVFCGGKASCFAYGQTGSGKTFTMMGSKPESPMEVTVNAGLYVLAAKDVFAKLKSPMYSNLQVYVSCFEIYGGKLFDLLNGRQMIKCLEDAKQQVQLPGLSEHYIARVEDLLQAMAQAHQLRSTGATGANLTSSRSHQILQLVLKEPAPVTSNVSSGMAHGSRRRSLATGPAAPIQRGKLSFIDLAGSERGADTTSNDKQTRMEGAEINTSLLALKEVIRSLERKHGHTPFRGSKLTQVLKDSFVGERSRTCMIACVSPSHSNCEHTLNTIRYADRVKEHQASQGGNVANSENAAAGGAIQDRPATSSGIPVSQSAVSSNNINNVIYSAGVSAANSRHNHHHVPPHSLDDAEIALHSRPSTGGGIAHDPNSHNTPSRSASASRQQSAHHSIRQTNVSPSPNSQFRQQSAGANAASNIRRLSGSPSTAGSSPGVGAASGASGSGGAGGKSDDVLSMMKRQQQQAQEELRNKQRLQQEQLMLKQKMEQEELMRQMEEEQQAAAEVFLQKQAQQQATQQRQSRLSLHKPDRKTLESIREEINSGRSTASTAANMFSPTPPAQADNSNNITAATGSVASRGAAAGPSSSGSTSGKSLSRVNSNSSAVGEHRSMLSPKRGGGSSGSTSSSMLSPGRNGSSAASSGKEAAAPAATRGRSGSSSATSNIPPPPPAQQSQQAAPAQSSGVKESSGVSAAGSRIRSGISASSSSARRESLGVGPSAQRAAAVSSTSATTASASNSSEDYNAEMIRRTVELLSTHKSSIANMVEVSCLSRI